MAEGLRAIGRKPALPRFEMIHWADILHGQPLDPSVQEPDDPRFIDEPYRPAPATLRPRTDRWRLKGLDLLGALMQRVFLNADYSLRYPRLTDTIVSRYFRDLDAYYREPSPGTASVDVRMKTRVLARAMEVVNRHRRDEIFLVCHSMGSIIAFDLLTFFVPQVQIHTLATIGSPLGMPNVISRLAAQHRSGDTVEPALRTPPGVTQTWANFSDTKDRIALNYKLGDDFAANTRGVSPVDYVVFNNYCVKGRRNPHKAFGYLRAPEFAQVLAAFLASRPTLRRRVASVVGRLMAAFRWSATRRSSN